MDYESDSDTDFNWRTRYSHQRIVKEAVNLEIKEKRSLSKLKYSWYRQEYWEESWKVEDTCCNSDSNK